MEDGNVSGWRLKNCPRCEYSLQGLPSAGTCPECGRTYDSDSIYLYGYGTGGKATAFNQPPPKTGQLIAAAIFTVWVSYRFLREGFRIGNSGWLIIMPFILWPYIWRRLVHQGLGMVQVKLTGEGFRQGTRQIGPMPYERATDAKTIPWRKARAVKLARQDENVARIEIRSRNRWWQLSRTYVDANVECSAQEIDAIAKKIIEWRQTPNAASEKP